MSDIIEVKNVSMQFKMDMNHTGGLKEWFIKALKGKRDVRLFSALTDISFSVSKGDVVGIIGKNGAGKSTLLKVISGIYKPTAGKVTVDGTIVPMLELGSGFDPELTGRENIYLNGAILGYPKDYLVGKTDEIIEFSELGEFINMPIKTYSSGMMMRLAFSIATVVDPEIMIVDEILSVGDEFFQKKSFRRMQEMMSGGTTVLFVSHSIEQVKSICNRVVWLENGNIREIGEADRVCELYSAQN